MTKGASLTPTMIPWGRLANGKLGLSVSDDTGIQKNSVLEVWDTLANAQAGGTDFPGRMILDTTTGLVFIFDPTQGGSGDYRELGSLPATVGNAGGDPPVSPTPLSGELYWDLDTKVAFVWDGTRWEPIGGRYAGQFVTAYHPNVSGVQSSFTLGLTVSQIDSIVGAPQNVEAFVDGTRLSAAAGDYTVTGGTINFIIPPPATSDVYLRTLVSDVIAPTAEVLSIETIVPAGPGEDTFDAGMVGISRSGTFTYVNGVMQTGPESGSASPDYTITSQDTCITKLEVTNPATGEVTVTTNATHGAIGGEQVTIENVGAEPLYEGTFQVENPPAPTANTFVVINTNAIGGLATINDPTCATGIFFTPPFLNDEIVFTTILPAGSKVLVKSVRNLATAESTGEVNDGTNIGAGVPVFKEKSGVDLVFRSILSGANISVVDTGSEVLINSTSANTFEDRNGINTTYHLLGSTESYIGVLSTASPVTIDLSSVVDITDAGRRVVIMDESGGAAVNNITIIHAGKTFNGQPNHIISSNYGTVTLVFSGSNWFVSSGTLGGGGGGAVTSVYGRTGAVVAQAGDYNAAKITYSNVGSGLTATDAQNAIDEVAQNVLPTGVMLPWGGDLASVPTGWLVCDGSTIGNTLSGAVHQGIQFENLFNIVKNLTGGATPYNTGLEDFNLNQTTKLPDMRGRTAFGPAGASGRLGSGSVEVPEVNVPGGSGGEDRHTLSESELASHDHNISGGSDLINEGSGKSQGTGTTDWGSTSPITQPAGGDQAHNTMPPFQMMYWIIKV